MPKVKSSISIIASITLILLISCSKTEQDKNIISDTKPKTETKHDSIRINTERVKDTISQNVGNTNLDSLRQLRDKKNRNDSFNSLKESEVLLMAYYFHPTARCVTCRNIEAYSYEAIQEWEEKNKKKVIWNELNIEDSVNEHYVDEYSLQFSSLVIVKYVGGNKDKWKNLEETWKLVNDKTLFKKYVLFELNQFIKNN